MRITGHGELRQSSTLKRCVVVGCQSLVRARGYCYAHDNRFLRYGDPKHGRTPRAMTRSSQRRKGN